MAARCFVGAYSEIKAAIFGITPPNPNPAIIRQIIKNIGVGANPDNNVKKLNKKVVKIIMRFFPKRSAYSPNKTAPIAVPIVV